jgi:hypothetical protein
MDLRGAQRAFGVEWTELADARSLPLAFDLDCGTIKAKVSQGAFVTGPDIPLTESPPVVKCFPFQGCQEISTNDLSAVLADAYTRVN